VSTPLAPARGRRRRRRVPLILLVLALVALTAAGASARLVATGSDRTPTAAAPEPATAPPPVEVPAPDPGVGPPVLPDAPKQDVLPPIAAPAPERPEPSGPRFALPATGAAVRLRPGTGPRGGALVDLGSGRVLWARGWRKARPIASVTKIMTALVAVDALTPRERIRVSRRAAAVRGSQAGIVAGSRMTADALLTALMLPSGNDAAVALAEGIAGSEARFVRRMNARARALGLTCTTFRTASGLGRGGYGGAQSLSCPADLAEMARRALAEPRIARIVRRPVARVQSGRRTLTVASTNPLVRGGVAGALGLKTGWTPSAGRCLVAVVRRDGRRYAAVLLDDGNPAGTAQALVGAATRRR